MTRYFCRSGFLIFWHGR